MDQRTVQSVAEKWLASVQAETADPGAAFLGTLLVDRTSPMAVVDGIDDEFEPGELTRVIHWHLTEAALLAVKARINFDTETQLHKQNFYTLFDFIAGILDDDRFDQRVSASRVLARHPRHQPPGLSASLPK